MPSSTVSNVHSKSRRSGTFRKPKTAENIKANNPIGAIFRGGVANNDVHSNSVPVSDENLDPNRSLGKIKIKGTTQMIGIKKKQKRPQRFKEDKATEIVKQGRGWCKVKQNNCVFLKITDNRFDWDLIVSVSASRL